MIKIGILGLGTVASGVVEILEKNGSSINKRIGDELLIEKILIKNKNKKRDLKLKDNLLTTDINELIDNPEIDMIVELIGGEEPAKEYIEKSLIKGKSVVTANKLVMAKHGLNILKLARKNNVQINYEGSVAGGIPIINPLKESLAANKITEISGILNGTTNYILSKMTQKGMNYENALKEAQDLGYAESEPSSDIDGYDAAFKIAILASIAYESPVNINSFYIEGIRNIKLNDIKMAKELNYVIKLLATAKRSDAGLDIRVHPSFIPAEHPLALVNESYNAIYIQGDAVGDVMSYGKGAGKLPTGSAVVSDIIQLARDISSNQRPEDRDTLFYNIPLLNIKEVYNSFYMRLEVRDKPGVMSRVTGILGNNNVSLASVIQKNRLTPVVPLVLITHPIREVNIQKSIIELKNLEDLIKINNIIRVEEELIS